MQPLKYREWKDNDDSVVLMIPVTSFNNYSLVALLGKIV